MLDRKFEHIESYLGLTFTDAQRNLLQQHLTLVIRKNLALNLTRITSVDQAMLLHIEDSLVALTELVKAPEGRYCDLGSGAGYPGIPLSILSGRNTVLVDSVKKKAQALIEFVEQLGLTGQIAVCSMRAEDLAVSQKGQFSVITARALSSLPSLVELASPLLCPNGILIALKAQPSEEEVESGKRVCRIVGMVQERERVTYLSDNCSQRTIITYRKVGESSIVLPRRVGLAQKRPLA